jgi:hypothetical protein
MYGSTSTMNTNTVIPKSTLPDYTGLLVATIIGVLSFPFYILLLVLSIPFYCSCYFFYKQKKDGAPGTFYTGYLFIYLGILVAYAILIASHVLTLPVALLKPGRTWRNYQLLRDNGHFRGSKVDAGLMLQTLVGAIHRQGICEFFWKLPIAFTVNPIIKYCLTSNLFLYKLELVFARQATAPSPAIPDEKLISGLLYDIETPILAPHLRDSLDHDRFCAHYPNVMGVQYNLLVLFTNTYRRNKLAVTRSHSGKFAIYIVDFHYFFPFHILTSYVEVNITHEHTIEHPMYSIVGTTHWPLQIYANVDNLFLNHVAPDTTSFIESLNM